jgi:hypothetical protein
VIPGEAITPATRRTLAVTIAAAAGDVTEPGVQLARARLDVLAPRGVATAELLTFLARVQGLLEPRCPRCLDPAIGLCSPCSRAHAAEVDLAARVRAYTAPPEDLLALSLRLSDLAQPTAPLAAGTEPGIEPVAAGQGVLDRMELEDVIAMCARKQRHVSQIDADKSARRCEEKRPWTRLRSYSCPACGGWHLTHQPPPQEAR